MSFELTLNKKEKFAEFIYGFWFKVHGERIAFQPGQFLEWTLEHEDPDSRGNQRFFTIASSPTEKEILLTTKIIEKPSSFKWALKNLQTGERIIAEGPYGEFVIPEKKEKKMVFLAGGIGVIPFRSIIKYLLDIDEKRDITLFYGANSAEEIAFDSLFFKAKERLGLKAVYVLSDKENTPKDWQGEVGYINEGIIKKHINNSKYFVFYVSGPESMVHSTSEMLVKMGIKKKQIKHDYFPGYSRI